MLDLRMPSSDMRASLENRATQYAAQLEGSPGQDYLSGRQITKEAQRYFRLGYVAEPLQGDERFRNSVSIPYVTQGGVLSVKFRRLSVGGIKYDKAKGEENMLFGVNALFGAEWVVVTEGEFDSIIWWQMGVPAVAAPGANTFKRRWLPIFRGRQVAVIAEGDDAGREKFAPMWEDSLAGVASRVVRVELPDGEDTNSLYIKEGSECLKRMLRGDRRS